MCVCVCVCVCVKDTQEEKRSGDHVELGYVAKWKDSSGGYVTSSYHLQIKPEQLQTNYFRQSLVLQVQVKLLSRVQLFETPWTVTY